MDDASRPTDEQLWWSVRETVRNVVVPDLRPVGPLCRHPARGLGRLRPDETPRPDPWPDRPSLRGARAASANRRMTWPEMLDAVIGEPAAIRVQLAP